MDPKDFVMDNQSYRFVGEQMRRGYKFYVFTSECAICRAPFKTVTPSWTLTAGRRCRTHALRGVPVGSTTEARRIRARGWEVADSSALDLIQKAGEVRNAGRPRSDPRPANPVKAEPPPRKAKKPKLTKRDMAAARAEKIRRRHARLLEKSAR